MVFRGKHNQLLMSESDVAEQRHYTKQLENVKTKSIDGQILNFETEYTNNLGVQFKVRCKKLHCMVRWIKYKGKIYRAVRYNTQTLGIEVNRKFEGINHAAKSEYIEHLINYNNDYIDSTYMRMDRVWFVDEQLGGLSVRQYRRLRNKLYNALKENNILAYKLSIGILNHPSTEKEYHIDPTVHLFLDEVFRDITEDEKEHILEIEKRNAMMRQSKRIGQ